MIRNSSQRQLAASNLQGSSPSYPSGLGSLAAIMKPTDQLAFEQQNLFLTVWEGGSSRIKVSGWLVP